MIDEEEPMYKLIGVSQSSCFSLRIDSNHHHSTSHKCMRLSEESKILLATLNQFDIVCRNFIHRSIDNVAFHFLILFFDMIRLMRFVIIIR